MSERGVSGTNEAAELRLNFCGVGSSSSTRTVDFMLGKASDSVRRFLERIGRGVEYRSSSSERTIGWDIGMWRSNRVGATEEKEQRRQRPNVYAFSSISEDVSLHPKGARDEGTEETVRFAARKNGERLQ